MTTNEQQSPQNIKISRGEESYDATIAWRRNGYYDYTVQISSPAFEPVEAHADDAFEALCRVRELLEPHGWRIGVAGAQSGVWPSGMGREQGGGLIAYRMSAAGAQGIVHIFEPVDPATVVTAAEQRAEADQLL